LFTSTSRRSEGVGDGLEEPVDVLAAAEVALAPRGLGDRAPDLRGDLLQILGLAGGDGHVGPAWANPRAARARCPGSPP
jgi:hypothetical protein